MRRVEGVTIPNPYVLGKAERVEKRRRALRSGIEETAKWTKGNELQEKERRLSDS